MAEKILAEVSRGDGVAEQGQPRLQRSQVNKLSGSPQSTLNILRFHQILRPNESFHAFLLFSTINLNNCY